MKLLKSALFLFLTVFSLSGFAQAELENVKKELLKKYPDFTIDKITRAGYGELYEIFTNGELLYTDAKATYLLAGALIDTATKTNVSEERLQKLSAINFKDLPLEQSIKLVRGKGTRKIAIFEDPNCGYCKRFEQDINSMDDITAYIFPYPILSPDSIEKSKAIWCSSDRLKAWQDTMLRANPPKFKATCETPIDKNVELGRKLRISGTPLTFFEDGERISGALPKEKIEAKIVEATKAMKIADAKK